MALKRHKRHIALKGNDRIGLMKLFRAFLTKALHTYRRTDRRTDGRTHALIEMRGRIEKDNPYSIHAYVIPMI